MSIEKDEKLIRDSSDFCELNNYHTERSKLRLEFLTRLLHV